MDDIDLAYDILRRSGHRLDANEVAFLNQALEHMKARVYEELFVPSKARMFIPVASDVDPGAESIAYEIQNEVRQAKLLANEADDIPMVEVGTRKESQLVRTIALGYGWSVIDVWRAAKAGRDLPDRKARACRRGIEKQIDEMGAVGHSPLGILGLVNQPVAGDDAVQLVSAGASEINGDWTNSGTTADDILHDVSVMTKAVVTGTGDVFRPNTLLLPTDQYAHIATKRVGTDNENTILKSILANNPWISTIESWEYLASAGATSTDRAISYFRDPEVVEYDIPLDFYQLPPERRGLMFSVPCLARVAGVKVHHPKAICYGDGI